MAAVHNQSSRQHPHSRLRSSSDPFSDPPPRSNRRPPPPPPKTSSTTRMSVAVPKSNPPNLTDAAYQQDHRSRQKASRSQTTQPASAVSTSSRPSGQRSLSDASVHAVEKPGKSHGKKSSQHADVIDRLDYTSGGPMFHHDGPFDACAPSRNKHHNKAPIYAWGTAANESSLRYGDNAYPSVDAYRAFSNDYPEEPPKKKVDAIAEAWGIHEPEPFEEFFAGGGSGRLDDTPASSIYNGQDSHNSQPHARRGRDSRDNRDRTIVRRSIAPPPQPIFVADPSEIELPESPLPSATGFPKRSKSLMHRIRKMRDSPNVPVGPDYDTPPSPPSPIDVHSPNGPRPTHRSQNSFLGRFGGASRGNQSPVTEKSEPYIFIEARTNKELPVLPTSTSTVDEDIPTQLYPETQIAAPSSSPERLGRKTSIMKKVGRVVRGAK